MTSFVDVRLGNDVKRFVIVPTWVASRLNERQLNFGTLFNFQKLSQLFNQMDLAELLAVQDTLHHVVGPITISFKDDVGCDPRYQYCDLSGTWYLHNLWRDQVGHDYEMNSALDNVLNYANSPVIREQLENRLYTVDEVAAQAAYQMPSFTKPVNDSTGLTIHDVCTETSVIVVAPGYFTTNNVVSKPRSDRAVTDLLASLYRSMSVPMVSRTSLFKRYLDNIIL